jgi:hypothetical protein
MRVQFVGMKSDEKARGERGERPLPVPKLELYLRRQATSAPRKTCSAGVRAL